MSSLFPTHHPSFAPFESWRLAITTSDDEKSMSSVAFADDLIVGSRWGRRGRRETEREQGRQKKLLTRRVHKRDAIGSNSFFFSGHLRKNGTRADQQLVLPVGRVIQSLAGPLIFLELFLFFFFCFVEFIFEFIFGGEFVWTKKDIFFFKCAAVAMILLLFHFEKWTIPFSL